MAGRKKLNKMPISIKIDKELKTILDKKNIEKSGLINALLWKYFGLETHISHLQTPNSTDSPAQIRTGVPGSRVQDDSPLHYGTFIK